MKHLISLGAVLALVATMAVPLPAAALDLDRARDRVSRGLDKVSDTLGGGGSTSGGSTGGTSTAGASGGTTSGGTTGTSGGGLAGGSVSVGTNGVKAKIGSSLLGGTSVELGLLGTEGAAQANATVGNSRVGAAVLSNRQLATLRVDANPPGTGNVALPGGAVGGVTPDYVRALLASLSRSEELIMKKRCAMILRSPKAFDAELVLLCQLVARL